MMPCQNLSHQAYESYACADRIVFVSRTTRELWAETKLAAEPQVVNNGIDVARLQVRIKGLSRREIRLKNNISPSDVMILTVGTLCERKGQLDVLEAISKLPPARLRCLKFQFIGARPSEYTQVFCKRADELSKTSGADIRIWQESRTEADAAMVAEAYLAADVFVMSSRVESYPRVVLEALFFSLPVISTRCFGALEMVQEGRCGHFYEAGDGAHLADLLARLGADHVERQRLARGARERFAQLPTYDQMIAAYQSIYTGLLGDRLSVP